MAVDLDAPVVSRWIEPLARGHGEVVDVFAERRSTAVLDWSDGEVVATQWRVESGLAARWADRREQRLVFVPRRDAAGAREALRELQTALGRAPLPIKPGGPDDAPETFEPTSLERWRKRLTAMLARHAPRHRFRWTWSELARDVVPARGAACAHARRLFSLEGRFLASSRRGDEWREFSFHAPDGESAVDELKTALSAAAAARESPVPCGDGETDVVFGGGSACVLFHEILAHALEAGSASPLTGLADARLATTDLDVRDDPTRLDLFGGYEWDDEGTRPRAVKLLDAGRLAGPLTTRTAGPGDASNGHARRASASDVPLPRGSNLVVAPGQVNRDEMVRRLGTGLWIDDVAGGSVELASGTFRVRFPRARRIRRGRVADELTGGVVAGEILAALKGVETGLGREARPYRSLGWCARAGQVVPVQGAAPDVLIRRLAVRGSR